jgi:hypothetical protein
MFFSHNLLAYPLVLLSVAACSRPMTDGEIAYTKEIITQGVDFGEVRFSGQEKRGIRKAERLLAQEVLEASDSEESVDRLISGLPSLFGADAFVIENTVYFDSDVYSSDFSTSTIDSDRWLMAHELTHVWQWQNRDVTGYTFAKVVSEHLNFGNEVYEYTLAQSKRFTEYRFEQQGAIVQCYVMLRQLMPNDPLTVRHESLIRSEFPLDTLLQLVESENNLAKVREEINRSTCDGL